jgi:hypothetical protein
MPQSEHIPTCVVVETRYPITLEQSKQSLFPVCALLQWQEKRMQQLATLRKKRNIPQ